MEKKGKNFWGCCPFHHEKTPSFCINEYEQFYHCFGCGESGDVITFLRKFENLEYIDAIRQLAENAGMELPQMQNNEQFVQQKKQKDTSLKILNFAKDFYKNALYAPTAKTAQEYIKKRKLTKRELDKFELGFSPNYYQIVNALKEQKFTDAELAASGVCEIGKNGKPYDFLSERLVFPIVNTQGDCIGFSGRDLSGSAMAKYKNTAATLVFNKSRAVYGINIIKKLKAEQAIPHIVLVEGQFDVITMHRYGFETTVACLGTAITKDHIRELKRLCDNLILCLDGDSAGQKATLRALEVFAEVPDVNLKVAVLPNGQDPDEFLQKYGADGMTKLLEGAITPMAFRLKVLQGKYNLAKLDEKTKFIKEALAELAKLSSVSEQELYLSELSAKTNISVDFLRRDLRGDVVPRQNAPHSQAPKTTPTELDGNAKATKFVLAAMLFKKEYAQTKINLEPFIINPSLKQLYITLKQNPNLRVGQVYEQFDVENDSMLASVINLSFADIDKPEEYFEECVLKMIKNELKFRKSLLSKQFKEEIDPAARSALLNKIAEIDKQLTKKNIGDFE